MSVDWYDHILISVPYLFLYADVGSTPCVSLHCVIIAPVEHIKPWQIYKIYKVKGV